MTSADSHEALELLRWRLLLFGDLQGVGFRPFLALLAKKHNLTGFVQNQTNGVGVELQGHSAAFAAFNEELLKCYKMNETIQRYDISLIDKIEENSFKIIKDSVDKNIVQALPRDQATCNDCLSELFDRRNRRYYYPFISCARCGPRFSIIKQLPFEREFTSMSEFSLCNKCHDEYQTSENRRYHAQTISCQLCGPKYVLKNDFGAELAENENALLQAVQVLLNGGILAVKSTGGIQLCALESSAQALHESPIDRLRKHKVRGDKPFAVMMRDVTDVKKLCLVNETEHAVLEDMAAPIVLLKKRNPAELSTISANHFLGIMLPSQPVYHIILDVLAQHGIDMLVVTSANPPGRPIIADSDELFMAMPGCFNAYLDHNREIIHSIEDSIVSVFQKHQIVLRFGRGYAPNFIFDDDTSQSSQIAFGADLKAHFALRLKGGIVVSPFISDLHTREQELAFEKSLGHFLKIYKINPNEVFCDMHPHYVSRHLAQDFVGKENSTLKKLAPIQHHYAHAASQLLHCPDEESLAIVCDGMGYAYDNEIWGCELFSISERKMRRIASLSPYELIGGDRASRDPGLCLLSLVYSLELDVGKKKELIHEIYDQSKSNLHKIFSNMNLPAAFSTMGIKCRSFGRLFDALAFFLADFKKLQSYEGQAAVALEQLATNFGWHREIEFSCWKFKDGIWELQWQDFIISLLTHDKNLRTYEVRAELAASFHNFFIDAFLFFAQQQGLRNIVLSGGAWQNHYLLQSISEKSRKKGIKLHLPAKLQFNDGCIGLGQILYKKLETIGSR